ncbi:hypothetical protein [Anaeromyxobacter oryzae]|uniref:Uncharacterized protein n=1 Tax=Anaeromyxobacter oryzae TaxID=2918170 RepID=A0ABM7WZA1_9BACT|nr:hypothetical protein [Anaeromyxobacter oryzae]BDG04866.1 hypothetical protein AMOR_38620 [Anaeromyxobacter oryzae]
MVIRALTVFRTLFLAYLVYYTFRATPLIMGLPENVTDPYPICKASNTALQKGIWMALAWIALETAIGWWWWSRASRKPLEPDVPRAGSSEPPFAPPSHR